MPAVSKILTRTSDVQRLNLAALVALAIHLLVLYALPSMQLLSESVERRFSVRLQIDSSPPVIEQASAPAALQPQKLPPLAKPGLETPLTKTPIPDSEPATSTVKITTADIANFAASEVQALIQTRDGALQQFAQTFTASTTHSKPQLTAYQNLYGDIHVRARLGDQEVCYQQNKQFADDDWGFNIVMFYACGTTEKFALD